MFRLIIFPTPLDSAAIFDHDSGYSTVGSPTTHPTGRPGVGLDFPDSIPNGNGGTLTIRKEGKVTLSQRGILYVRKDDLENGYPWIGEQNAAFSSDDFRLQDVPTPPAPPPQPPTPPTPLPSKDPLTIITRIYNEGDFDLSSKDGCGEFTEAACEALHNQSSAKWGHLKKSGAQNQYNGHAVDAVQLLSGTPGADAGIYDIIQNSESDEARVVFNRVGPPDAEKWYYPA